ncbi:MAG: hypothetical protein IAF08_03220, partial [Rhizobacter sp.]|nr:hypothetical protein [Chlorobiales bacterium]
MLKQTFLTISLALCLCGSAAAQKNPYRLQHLEPSGPNVNSNSVSQFSAGSTAKFWLGTGAGLNATTDGGLTFFKVDEFPKFNDNGIYALDVKGNTVWASTAFVAEKDGDFIPTGDGMIYSLNGGSSWTFVPQPLDQRGDTVATYGANQLSALDVIVPEQNVIYKLAIGQTAGSVWTSQWAGGIRHTTNNGQSWQRVPLPPSGRQSIAPTDVLNFSIDPRANNSANTANGFSVLVASDASVWAGTTEGVCKADSGDYRQFPSWTKYNRQFSPKPDGSPTGISGNWITNIKEQPRVLPGDSLTIWLASWRASDNAEYFAASYTTNGGRTWQTALDGEKLYDFSFDGNTVYAAGVNGLFISADKGKTWINKKSIVDRIDSRKFINPRTEFYAVQVEPFSTGKRLWLGTGDGTAVSTDGGNTWNILRAEKPVDNTVRTYSYPNPFSPKLDGLVRLRYKLDAASSVTVRVYDFSMSLVKTVQQNVSRAGGEQEESWNGRTEFGGRVANGVYFYSVDISGDKKLWGKVLVL